MAGAGCALNNFAQWCVAKNAASPGQSRDYTLELETNTCNEMRHCDECFVWTGLYFIERHRIAALAPLSDQNAKHDRRDCRKGEPREGIHAVLVSELNRRCSPDGNALFDSHIAVVSLCEGLRIITTVSNLIVHDASHRIAAAAADRLTKDLFR